MRQFGFSNEEIDRERNIEQDLGKMPRIVVWQENWYAAQVFIRCQWSRMLVGDKLLPIGIDGTEIEVVAKRVAAQLKLPRKHPSRMTLFDDVRFLEGVAGPILQG